MLGRRPDLCLTSKPESLTTYCRVKPELNISSNYMNGWSEEIVSIITERKKTTDMCGARSLVKSGAVVGSLEGKYHVYQRFVEPNLTHN